MSTLLQLRGALGRALEDGRLSLPLRFSARFWSRSVPGLGRVAPNALFGGCRRPAAGRFPGG